MKRCYSKISLIRIKGFYSHLPIFFAVLFCNAGSVKAQDYPNPLFNLQLTDASILDVFIEIETQSTFRFIYDASSIDSFDLFINLDIQNKNLDEVLFLLKQQSPLKFRQSGSSIAVAIRKQSQEQTTISGFITDSLTGEYLIGAIVYLKEHNIGAATNQHGFYSLNSPVKQARVRVQYLGYQPIEFSHQFTKNRTLDFKLSPNKTLIEEVVVSTTNTQDIILNNVDGESKIGVRDIRSIPVTFSERDIVKSTHFLPGITRISGGTSGYSVRGSPSSENLLIFDNATLYNISHTMADLSVFNPDIVQNMSLYKGGVPAKYGGRGSSVLDVAMRNGNKEHFATSGGVSLVSSRLAIEGPVIKNKLSYLLSYRRSNLGWLKFANETINKYYFFDLNVKMHYALNNRHKLAISSYLGKDVTIFSPREFYSIEQWHTQSGSLNWEFSRQKLFLNSSVQLSKYHYQMYHSYVGAYIKDISAKQDLNWYFNANNKLDAGWLITYHAYHTYENRGINSWGSEVANNIESNLYLSHRLKINNKLIASFGIRLVHYGKGIKNKWVSEPDSSKSISSLRERLSGTNNSWLSFEPRAAINYKYSENVIVKGSFNRLSQNLHQVSYVGAKNNQFFAWIPSTSNIKPLLTDQISIGLYGNNNSSKFSYSVEAFCKQSKNSLSYFSDSTGNNILSMESPLLATIGKSYGMEFFARFTGSRIKANIAYTIMKSLGKSEHVNNGKWYKSNYHKPHNLAIYLNYELSKNWSISTNWLYNSGMPSSFSYNDLINNTIDFDIQSINQYKLPSYHRLDIGASYKNHKKQNNKFQTSWNFNIYNVYNRKNSYIAEGISQDSNSNINNASIFYDYGIMPSVSLDFSFR
jgi:hypothetical protein